MIARGEEKCPLCGKGPIFMTIYEANVYEVDLIEGEMVYVINKPDPIDCHHDPIMWCGSCDKELKLPDNCFIEYD